MPDYKQGKIYTIRCKTDDTLIYVGSTVQSLSERMAKHRYDSIKRSNNFFYQHIDDWDNWHALVSVCARAHGGVGFVFPTHTTRTHVW